jgi:phosphatidate phosphatase APP1
MDKTRFKKSKFEDNKFLGITNSIDSICTLSRRSYENVITILQTTIMHIISDFDNTIFLNNATQFENAVMEKTTMILNSKQKWILETFKSEV